MYVEYMFMPGMIIMAANSVTKHGFVILDSWTQVAQGSVALRQGMNQDGKLLCNVIKLLKMF